MDFMLSIKLAATLANLGEFTHSVFKWLRSYDVSQKQIMSIELALEEALVNVCRYAYKEQTGDVEVRCIAESNDRFLIEIIDSGTPFDVCSVPVPDLKACIAERKIGGLGIHFIKKMATNIEYCRKDGFNVLSLTFQSAPDQTTKMVTLRHNTGH
ncbi:MAG: Serine-protein kinase RsbW [Syntrophus sp. SKADARSKE-3]|nr:Serine-protein kinase RsbW [Syntrophus sp. SKADARSKE-3]